ncbi:hypothetical protein TNCV_3344911 [Trichonephila clavipes]|nr:hypothetical protein TNCV_3344911 [Trichonephila clavipes]
MDVEKAQDAWIEEQEKMEQVSLSQLNIDDEAEQCLARGERVNGTSLSSHLNVEGVDQTLDALLEEQENMEQVCLSQLNVKDDAEQALDAWLEEQEKMEQVSLPQLNVDEEAEQCLARGERVNGTSLSSHLNLEEVDPALDTLLEEQEKNGTSLPITLNVDEEGEQCLARGERVNGTNLSSHLNVEEVDQTIDALLEEQEKNGTIECRWGSRTSTKRLARGARINRISTRLLAKRAREKNGDVTVQYRQRRRTSTICLARGARMNGTILSSHLNIEEVDQTLDALPEKQGEKIEQVCITVECRRRASVRYLPRGASKKKAHVSLSQLNVEQEAEQALGAWLEEQEKINKSIHHS